MGFRLFKSASERVAEFRSGRSQQSDDDYLKDLGLPDEAHVREVALAVRRAVAKVGRVDPLYIRADDRERVELSVLPLWDSMDWVELLLELEDELGMSIPDREAERIDVRNFSVRSCVNDTLQIVRRLKEK